MTTWIIGGGAVLAAWAMLSVVGGELTRRTADLHNRVRARREAAAAAESEANASPLGVPSTLQLR